MIEFIGKTDDDVKKLLGEGKYVANYSLPGKAWNSTVGQLYKPFGYTPGYCGEWQEWGAPGLRKNAEEVFGKDNVETGDVMISWGDPITDTTGSYFNHIANTIYVKSTGKTYVVDYWESGATGKPVIMTPEEWVAKWRDTISIGNDGVVYGDGNGRLEADLKAKGISLGDRADKRPPRSSSSTSAPASPSPIGPIIPLHR